MPNNLSSILSALAEDDIEMADIADRIAGDPPLTAYLLKVANSAFYELARKVATIREAVTIIGIRGLRNILMQYGVTSILGSLPSGAAELWRHSNSVAYYARYLALRRKAFQSLVDDALVGGVLHDMGMIVQFAVNAKLIERIEAMCAGPDIPPRLMEDILTGLNHARIGALLARKWNFPEVLIQEIEYHHRPWAAAPEYRMATSLVYLADCLCEEKDGQIGYGQINSDILRENGIFNAGDLADTRKEISEAYARASAEDERRKR